VVGLSGGASRLEDGWWLPEGHGNDLVMDQLVRYVQTGALEMYWLTN